MARHDGYVRCCYNWVIIKTGVSISKLVPIWGQLISKKNVEQHPQPPSDGGTEEKHSGKLDPFVLEELFPDVEELFKSHVVKPVTNGDVLVALDTSAMLLPYKTSSGSLSVLGDVYNQLAKQGRLFVPARAAREFAKTEIMNSEI